MEGKGRRVGENWLFLDSWSKVSSLLLPSFSEFSVQGLSIINTLN